jgi:hypothetical protein
MERQKRIQRRRAMLQDPRENRLSEKDSQACGKPDRDVDEDHHGQPGDIETVHAGPLDIQR